MDIVFIQALAIETIIGVFDWEREIKQTVILDIDMAWDNAAAAVSDDLTDALDYGAVSQRLIDYVAATEFQLIEALAEQCCVIIQQEFNVPWLRLKLSKPGAVPEAVSVGLLLERGNKPVTTESGACS